ncbi:hypothetical protein D3C71_2122990 [compost metagenome]
MRSAMAVTAATAPAPTWPWVHSHNASPLLPRISSTISTWLTISNWLTSRIWALPVARKASMAERA